MIDFRYHLVSLISVFIALAIGIVLGAGPLRESIGVQLAGQVEQLRTEMDDMRATNDTLTTERDQLTGYIEASAPQMVDGTLQDRSVAVFAEHESTRAPQENVESLIATAGGQVELRITAQPGLWSPTEEDQRAAAVDGLRGIDPALIPADGTEDVDILAEVITGALTGTGAAADASQREEIWSVLADNQIVTVDGDPALTVDSVVYIGADPAQFEVAGDDAETAGERVQSLVAAQTSLMLGLSQTGAPAVVSAVAPTSGSIDGVLSTVRGDTRFSDLSTTDRLQEPDGPVLSVLALAEQTTGGVGDYGTDAEADARVPEVPQAVTGTGQQTEDPTDGEQEDTDGEQAGTG